MYLERNIIGIVCSKACRKGDPSNKIFEELKGLPLFGFWGKNYCNT